MQNKLVVLFMMLFIVMNTQAQHFEGGLQVGVNLCQVDGDFNAGYNKLGFNGGVFVHYVLPKESHSLGFDLMYMGKGSRNRRDPQGIEPVLIYSYHYVEVPLYYRYVQKKYAIRGGLAWAYVFSSKYDDGGSPKPIIGLRNADYLLHFGGEYFVSEQLSVFAGYEYSIRSIIDSDKSSINLPLAQFRRNGVYHNLVQVSLKYLMTK